MSCRTAPPWFKRPPVNYKIPIPGRYPNGIRRILGVRLK